MNRQACAHTLDQSHLCVPKIRFRIQIGMSRAATLNLWHPQAFELGWITTDKGRLSAAATSTTSTTRYAECSGTAAATSDQSSSSTNASALAADDDHSQRLTTGQRRSGPTSVQRRRVQLLVRRFERRTWRRFEVLRELRERLWAVRCGC